MEEKQELLVQAAKAMELMESSQRKQQEASCMTKNDLEQKVHELEVIELIFSRISAFSRNLLD